MKLSELLAKQPELDMEIDDVESGAMIVDAMLLLRDIDVETRSDSIGIWGSEGLTGIVEYGMICSAKYDLERMMWQGQDGPG